MPLTPVLPSVLTSLRLEELSVRRFKPGTTGSALGRDPYSNVIASGDRYTGLMDLSLPLSLDYVRSTSRVHYRGDFINSAVASMTPRRPARALL